MKYSLNFRKLVRMLLPFSVRKLFSDFVTICVSPYKSIHSRFLVFRDLQLNRLYYNSQYPNFQRLLNDRYDGEQRRIRVYDNEGNIASTVAYDSGSFGKVQLHTVIKITSAQQWGYRPFTVELPAELNDIDTLNQINKTVNNYKFSGTKYTIIFNS